MRLFAESGFTARGNILSLEDFRLFLDWETLKFDEKKVARLIASAEDLLENYELTTITLSMYRQYFTSGVLSHFSNPYQKRGSAMFILGMAEAIERKGRFTEKLVDIIWAIMEETTWVLPQHSGHTPMGAGTQAPPVVGDKYLHGIELGSAYRTAAMAVVYHYCRDIIEDFAPVVAERMVHEMKKRTILPFISTIFSWTGEYNGKCNNWCPWNVSNILLTTALIEENMSVREQVVTRAMAYVDNFVDGYMPDGGCNEGATYWKAAAGSLFDCLETLYDMTGGKLSLFDNELVRKMGEFEAVMNISGRSFVNFADGSPIITPPANLMSRYGRRCGSEVLESFGKYMATHEDYDFAYAHPYRSLRSLYTPSVEGDVPAPKAYVANYLPYLKVATFRDSENPSEGMFVAIKGGHNGESHNHNDVGSFIIYKEGKPVIIDAGVGGYTRDTFGPRRYTIWSMQSLYHNVAQFNGMGEMQGAAYKSSEEEYDEAKKSLSLEIAGAFPKSYGVESYKRKIALKDGVVTLVDKVKLCEPMDVDFILMVHRRPEEADGKLLLAEGCTLSYDSALEYECEEFDPVGMDTVTKWGTPVLYRLHFRTHTDACEYTFVIDGN